MTHKVRVCRVETATVEVRDAKTAAEARKRALQRVRTARDFRGWGNLKFTVARSWPAGSPGEKAARTRRLRARARKAAQTRRHRARAQKAAATRRAREVTTP